MRLSLIFILLPAIAQAHPGHLAEAAGHNHWIAGAAIGAAIAIAIWAGLKGKKDAPDAQQAEPEDSEEAEA